MGMLIVILLACADAALMLWLFDRYDTLQNSKLVHLAHGGVIGLLVYLYLMATGHRLGAGGSMIGGAGNALIVFCGLLIIAVVNAPVIANILGSYLVGAARWMSGINNIRVSKTYEKAEAAEKDGDLEKAAGIYRQELNDDPEDPTAHRRLAELLLELERTEEAIAEFEKARVFLEEDKDNWCNVTFRLAEVIADVTDRTEEAEGLYREVIERYPESDFATYARDRLDKQKH